MEREAVVCFSDYNLHPPTSPPPPFWSLELRSLEDTFLCQSIPLQWGSAEVGD